MCTICRAGFKTCLASQSDVDQMLEVGSNAVVRDYTALLGGHSWSPNVVQSAFITYNFISQPPAYAAAEQAGTASSVALSEAMKSAVRAAFAELEANVGLKFYEVDTGGTSQIGMFDFKTVGEDASAAFAYLPSNGSILQPSGGFQSMGDIYFNRNIYGNGQDATQTAKHEIGHALGLKHSFEGTDTLATDLDKTSVTVMSYTVDTEMGFRPLDFQALQSLYGPASGMGSHLVSHSFDAASDVLTQVAGGGADRLFGVKSKDILRGGDGNDSIYANFGADTVFAGGGDDSIVGGGENDILLASTGNDIADGGDGNDEVYMGSGNDTASGGNGTDVLGGGVGADSLRGGEGADTLFGGQANGVSGADTIIGDGGNDLAFGGRGDAGLENDLALLGDGADTIFAGVGNDQVQGGEGNDLLFGGAQDDVIFGEGGADTIWGGVGNDQLGGGAGPDVFGFAAGSGVDRIIDFDAGDRLWFSGTTKTFNSAAEVKASANGATIDLGGGANVTLNVDVNSLTDANFIFGLVG